MVRSEVAVPIRPAPDKIFLPVDKFIQSCFQRRNSLIQFVAIKAVTHLHTQNITHPKPVGFTVALFKIVFQISLHFSQGQ